MTLLDAQPFDTARARRRKITIAVVIVTVVAIPAASWMYRNWPEERIVSHFFAALEHQDYDSAYAIYFNDPNWRLHQQNYSKYPFADFYRDWGPGGEWGLIKSFRIYGSAATKGLGGGVIVEVVVNERAERARLFVLRTDKTITVYPY